MSPRVFGTSLTLQYRMISSHDTLSWTSRRVASSISFTTCLDIYHWLYRNTSDGCCKLKRSGNFCSATRTVSRFHWKSDESILNVEGSPTFSLLCLCSTYAGHRDRQCQNHYDEDPGVRQFRRCYQLGRSLINCNNIYWYHLSLWSVNGRRKSWGLSDCLERHTEGNEIDRRSNPEVNHGTVLQQNLFQGEITEN